MDEIGLEQALNSSRRLLGLDVVVDLRRDRRVGTEAASDVDVIALDRVALVRGLRLAGEQSDVADIVLGAGVVASGEMDVHGPIERDAALAPACDLLGVALGVRGRELAADIAGAGDE